MIVSELIASELIVSELIVSELMASELMASELITNDLPILRSPGFNCCIQCSTSQLKPITERAKIAPK